jgi:outer membrane immunogenic protein
MKFSDLAVGALFLAPLPVAPLYSWSGFYAGANAGYAWSNVQANSTATPTSANPNFLFSPDFATALGSLGTYSLRNHRDGFVGGGQIGYNWQLTNWIAGLEADIQGLSHNNTGNQGVALFVPCCGETYNAVQSASRTIDWLGTVRGRLGILATPNLLVYGTGGLAYGSIRTNVSVAGQAVIGGFPDPLFTPLTGGAAFSQTRAGWTVGGGFEWLFSPQWSAKFEYLHFDLGSTTASYTLAQPCTGTGGVCAAPYATASVRASSRFDGDLVRVGVNYHFSGPVVAKY